MPRWEVRLRMWEEYSILKVFLGSSLLWLRCVETLRNDLTKFSLIWGQDDVCVPDLLLLLKNTAKKKFGFRAFSNSAPRLRNALPQSGKPIFSCVPQISKSSPIFWTTFLLSVHWTHSAPSIFSVLPWLLSIFLWKKKSFSILSIQVNGIMWCTNGHPPPPPPHHHPVFHRCVVTYQFHHAVQTVPVTHFPCSLHSVLVQLAGPLWAVDICRHLAKCFYPTGGRISTLEM